MPKERGLTAWNYLASEVGYDENISVTYWMNKYKIKTAKISLFLNPFLEPNESMYKKKLV